MLTRVKGKWGIHSRQYVRVQDHAANLDHCADELFVRKSKSILRLMTQWLADLVNEAQTATEITETTAKLAEFLEMLTDVDAETGDRREKSEDRVIAGNALYDTTMIYLGYGFEHYSKTGEAKVDDYILQKFLGNGASTLPDIPGGLRYDMVEQKAFWEDTETETSYEIEITENGVVTQIFIGQNVTEYAIAMGATAKEMRIRSRNAAGVSGWTPKVIIPPVAQPAKPSNLIFTPAAGSNDASISATRPAGAVAMIVGYAADGHPMSELGYMTEEGVYVWNPWLTPGTYYVRAEYPGGILSDWETLHIT